MGRKCSPFKVPKLNSDMPKETVAKLVKQLTESLNSAEKETIEENNAPPMLDNSKGNFS